MSIWCAQWHTTCTRKFVICIPACKVTPMECGNKMLLIFKLERKVNAYQIRRLNLAQDKMADLCEKIIKIVASSAEWGL